MIRLYDTNLTNTGHAARDRKRASPRPGVSSTPESMHACMFLSVHATAYSSQEVWVLDPDRYAAVSRVWDISTGCPAPTRLGSWRVGIRPSRERTTAANAQHNTAVRSVIRTTGYIPGSLAGAHASARSGPQTVARRRRGLTYMTTCAQERARSSLSTAAPTPSTLGDLRPACPPP